MPRVPIARRPGRSSTDAFRRPFRFTITRPGRRDDTIGRPPDGVPDLVGGTLRVDDTEPIRLGRRELEEPVANAPVEVEVEAELEPRLVVRGLASKPDLDGQVEEDREVGTEAAGRDRLEPSELGEGDAGPVALVGERRIGEPGADHGRPGRQARADDLVDELSACGAEEERIRQRRDRRGGLGCTGLGCTGLGCTGLGCTGLGRLAVVSEKDRSDMLAEPRTTRLPRPEDIEPVGPEVSLEADGLRRFPGALGSLDRDEPAAVGWGRRSSHESSVARARTVPRRVPGATADPFRHGARTLGVMGRRLIRAAALAILAAAIPGAVLAHPLGNFTINHFAGISVTPTEIRLDVVIDMAEIPTFQERRQIDADGDGDVTDAEAADAAPVYCSNQASLLTLSVDGSAAALQPTGSSIGFPAGLGGLSTMRLECGYTAPLPPSIAKGATLRFEDLSYPERIGWREIVAGGEGVTVEAPGLPATSPSARLTKYPTEMISQPLDIRSATIHAVADAAVPTATPATGGAAVATAAGAVPGGIGGELPDVFRAVDLTPLVLLLSIVTALGLGAGHALTPGHGKTLMAAYLVGTRGTALHAVGLGLAVTVSHTLGIVVLAVLVVGAQGLLPPDVVVRTAPVVAAVTIVAIGGWMLFAEARRRLGARRGAAAAHAHDHGHVHDHDRNHDRVAAPSEHSHGGIAYSHVPPAGSTLSWRGLFALGLAGGLIPSTSALFILLGAIVAGRPAFGFVLVVVFGLGMALVMTGVGLAMVFARERLDRMPSRSGLGRLARHAPLVAAVVVLAFGVYLTAQAIGGRPVL
jgi:nickel/cobalt exporter